MSTNNLEKALWDLSVSRESKDRFRQDAPKFLSRYHLSERETQMVLRFDVKGLADCGVSTMLTMGFWREFHSEDRDLNEYLDRLRAPASAPE